MNKVRLGGSGGGGAEGGRGFLPFRDEEFLKFPDLAKSKTKMQKLAALRQSVIFVSMPNPEILGLLTSLQMHPLPPPAPPRLVASAPQLLIIPVVLLT